MRFLRLLKPELAAEAKSWVDEGLVSQEQAERILARYGARLPDGRERSAGYYVLISLAALFGGLALLVLVSANWDQIPRHLRMAGLVLVTLTFHGLGLRSWGRGKGSLALVWFFLGCLAYGTTIFLIAQIYHLGEHYPDGIFWWAAGSLPFALLTGSLPIALLSAALSGAWLIAEASESFLPTAWPVLGAGLAYYCLRLRHSKLLFLILVASGTLWLELLIDQWVGKYESGPSNELLPLSLGLFALYHGWGRHWEDRRESGEWAEYGAVLRLWAVRLGIVLLLVFGFEGPWQGVLELRYTYPAWVVGGTVTVLVGVATMWRFALLAAPERARRWWAVWCHVGAFTTLVAISLLTTSDHDYLAVPLQVMTNLMTMGVGIWLIVVAIEDGLSHYFYAGVGIILVTALLRYVDLVGDYVGAALLFFVFSLILFGAARFWQRRMGGLAP